MSNASGLAQRKNSVDIKSLHSPDSGDYLETFHPQPSAVNVMSSATMGSTVETKSEFIVSPDEEKQEVSQSQEGSPQVPEQQTLLEVSCHCRCHRLRLLR